MVYNPWKVLQAPVLLTLCCGDVQRTKSFQSNINITNRGQSSRKLLQQNIMRRDGYGDHFSFWQKFLTCASHTPPLAMSINAICSAHLFVLVFRFSSSSFFSSAPFLASPLSLRWKFIITTSPQSSSYLPISSSSYIHNFTNSIGNLIGFVSCRRY